MKYPAIYKSVEGSEYLYQNKDSYYCYERQLWDSSEPHHDCHHSDTNITAEYLANTYGEVENKEHAEFIVKLAEVNGFDIGIKSNTPSVFEFSGMLLNIYANPISSFAHNVESKLITIPLPPECDEKIYRHEGMGKKPKHFDCICNKCGGRCCIGNCDEWPKVGSKVTWGNCSYTAEVIAIHNNMAWVFTEGEYHNEIAVSKLQKPKTPEQELFESFWKEVGLFMNQSNLDKKIFESAFINNITKKGEGDGLQ